MLDDGNILVIDDNEGQGEVICDRLRKQFIPYRFFHFTEDNLISKIDEGSPLVGVRVIFQDLNLIEGTATPNNMDYATASSIINALLVENNGPWLLVTWSTYTGTGPEPARFADELFTYLNESLPEGKRPFQLLRIDKNNFSLPTNNGEKTVEDIPEDKKIELSKDIEAILSDQQSLSVLYEWEKSTRLAAANSVAELSNISSLSPAEKQNETLGNMMHAIAAAEAGRHHDDAPLGIGLHSALNRILKDKSEVILNSTKFEALSKTNTDIDIPHWDARVNKAIHLENKNPHKLHRPGTIYHLSLDELTLILPPSFQCDTEKKLLSFIRDRFISLPNSATKKEKEEVARSMQLVAIDVTPDCDYANKKTFWNRFMIGILLPENLLEYIWRIDFDKVKEGNSDYRVENELKSQNLYMSPKLYISLDGFKDFEVSRFLFNSELLFPIKATSVPTILIDHEIGTIRESLLNQLRSWMAGQSTRPGIVELRL